MAKLNINIDTDPNNRGFSIVLNGQVIPNVQEVSAYQDLDDNGKISFVGMSIFVREVMDDNTIKNISYHSCGSEKAKKIEKSEKMVYTNIEGFIGKEEENAVSKDIIKFFEKNRRFGV